MNPRILNILHVPLVLLVAGAVVYKLGFAHDPPLTSSFDIFLIGISSMLILINLRGFQRSKQKRLEATKLLDTARARMNAELEGQDDASQAGQ